MCRSVEAVDNVDNLWITNNLIWLEIINNPVISTAYNEYINIYILYSYIKGTRVSGAATVSGSEPHEERVDTRHSRSTGHLSATPLAFVKIHSVLLTDTQRSRTTCVAAKRPLRAKVTQTKYPSKKCYYIYTGSEGPLDKKRSIKKW